MPPHLTEPQNDTIAELLPIEENGALNQAGCDFMDQPDDHQEKKAPLSPELAELMSRVEAKPAAEEKIGEVLSFMEECISKGATPHFRFFWEARKISLQLFKAENLPFTVRGHLWNKYVEISKEAYRLKEILDEQSAFAVDQIDLAVKGLEEEIDKASEAIQSDPEVVFPAESLFLKEKESSYKALQKDLNQKNAFAARINSLRKELIKTEMRIRFKNRFFQRLSELGDKVFPKRKELIKEVSTRFQEDVERFILENFKSGKFNYPLYQLREEIKALQGFAKVLTLNTQAFNKTRISLSECWDHLKKLDKERKKERAETKQHVKEGVLVLEKQLDDFIAEWEAGSLSIQEANRKLEEVVKEIRDTHLAREDIKPVREKLSLLRAKVMDKIAHADRERLEKEREVKDKRKRDFETKCGALEAIAKSVTPQSIEEAIKEQSSLKEELEALKLTKTEKQDLDRLLKRVSDAISKAKLSKLPDSDREAYDHWNDLLQECIERRQQIRKQLEIYRKARGSSGLDLEQALKQRELFEHEKERLDQVEQEIVEIEEKLSELNE